MESAIFGLSDKIIRLKIADRETVDIISGSQEAFTKYLQIKSIKILMPKRIINIPY